MAGQPPVALSVDAIARAASRISLLFCGTAVLGLPFAVRGGWQQLLQPRALLVLAGLLVTFAAAVQAFARDGGARWAVATGAVLTGTTALVSASTDTLRPDAAHQIVSWTNAGIGGALGLTYGFRAGGAILAAFVAAGFGVEYATAGTIALPNIVGPLTYVLGASLARAAAFRGDAATERALAAKEAAEGALRVAEERWDAARAAQRQLHDTVLATLTMLAHRGQGVPADTVVQACRRDVELLQHGPDAASAVDPDDGPVTGLVTGPVTGPGVDARPEAVPSALPTTQRAAPDGTVALPTEILAAVSVGRASGFDVRLHAAGRGYDQARLAAPVAAALRQALRECLWNARQHSGVQAADVTVIVDDGLVSVIVLDEGRGFELSAVPADRLGLRDSVSARMTDVGGQATVWSGTGLGTSVLLTAPIATPATGSRRVAS